MITELCKRVLADDAPAFIELLQEHGAADYSHGTCSGHPILHTAVVFNRLDIVKALLSAGIGGVDVNGLRDYTNSSALDVAIYLGRVEMIDVLIGLVTPTHTFTPLHLAAISGNPAAVRRLLTHPAHLRGDVNAVSKQQLTPLHCVANKTRVDAMQKHAQIYEQRVLEGILQEQSFRLVWNPPQRVENGSDLRAVVDMLVAAGADITILGKGVNCMKGLSLTTTI